MGPRPYSDNSSLPNDPSLNDPLSTVPTQILAETPTSSTSTLSTPSPTQLEIISVEQHVDTLVTEDNETLNELVPCYPTPEDIMPYDHSLPDFIRQITNERNLSNLQSLNLRVNSTCVSLHRMAAYLPNLRELDLEGSILSSLRDIGCNFKNLQILRVGRCQLESLDGTFGLSSLREFYAEKNLISDVSPCSNLPHIRHIDVSGNRIRNISYAGFLSVCSKLKSIVFTGNPATEVADYRNHVRRILPQIETLDGVPFTAEDNEDEIKESEMIENLGSESDSSVEYPDFYSVSPSDSMNNLLDSEEDVNCLEKKFKQAKNVANQDQFESYDCDVQGGLSASSKTYDLPVDTKHLTLQRSKNTEGILERPKATKLTDTRNMSIKHKTTSIQKLDKDNENRSKKSNLLLKTTLNEEFISLPEIVPGPSSSHVSSNKMASESGKQKFEIQHLSVATTAKGNDVQSEEAKTGAIKKKLLSPLSQISNTIPQTSEKCNLGLGISSLTSGLPISGNLTAALRSRSKAQESKVGNFKTEAEYIDIT